MASTRIKVIEAPEPPIGSVGAQFRVADMQIWCTRRYRALDADGKNGERNAFRRMSNRLAKWVAETGSEVMTVQEWDAMADSDAKGIHTVSGDYVETDYWTKLREREARKAERYQEVQVVPDREATPTFA